MITLRNAGIMIFGMVILMGILVGSSYAKVDPKWAMGMWLFDDDGDVGLDSSKNAVKSDVSGVPKWTDAGKFGGGLIFDATDDVIKADMTVDYDEITVMVWVNEAGSPVRPRIVSNDHTDVSFKGFQLMYNTAGSGSWFDIGNGTLVTNATFAYTAKQGEWFHYAGTYDGKKVRAYIDGELKIESADTSKSIADSGIPVHIGTSTYGFSDGFKGTLDEIAILNKALSADEILEVMNDGLLKATGLAAVDSSGKLAKTWAEVRNQH